MMKFASSQTDYWRGLKEPHNNLLRSQVRGSILG